MTAVCTDLRAVAAMCCIVAISGCVGLSRRVDRTLLRAVPNEELLVLFDAENAVYIARDESEMAGRNVEEARTALKRANSYTKIIDQRRKSGAAIDSPQVLDLLEKWNNARIVMREAELALRTEELRTNDVRLWAARARYERAKATLAKDKNPAGASDLKLEDFDAQVKEWDTREAAVHKVLEERQAAVVEGRARYFEVSQQLQLASRGAYGGPWADLLD